MSRFVPVDRQTGYLLPPSVEDWLPEDHLARFVVEVIEQLDLPELSLRFTHKYEVTRFVGRCGTSRCIRAGQESRAT
ncbi:hypothetical protein R75465_08603 [Paraburkholderia aspalathi]|uniref:hypothetical protein n=1 Tax=Paraburkholderia aspalathi TaxID=1324617 RepID=UPI001B2280A3|nr:hypothetical protein [Paraburkholderia aspalathi]CAE6875858.1 hypothetical protein R75465_08603 [Paraburkholderia aspalathi]